MKSPKLYFVDSGLACWLLGIHRSDTLALHPLLGDLFETLMMGKARKGRDLALAKAQLSALLHAVEQFTDPAADPGERALDPPGPPG